MRRLLPFAALLAAVTFPVLADERMEHAEWISEFRDGTGEASTKDISMAKFGMLCGEESCRFYYENGIQCEPGNNYPIVIATSAGSIAVETVCAPTVTVAGDATRYWFADTPQFSDALMQSDTVGIAFPLSNGQFRISQFLMNGFGEAAERVSAVLRARKADREAREAAERERRAREAAERARKAQEAAERARKAQEAAERARKAAEQEAAERARVAAEREAAERAKAEQEAAERARIAAEQEAAERAKAAAEQEAAERAKAAAEQEAAERAKAAQEAAERAKAAAEQEAAERAKAAAEQEAAERAAKAQEQSGQVSSPAPASAQETAAPAEPTGEAAEPDANEESVKPGGTDSPRGKRLPSRL